MREQPFSPVIVSIALLACFLCVSQIPRHEMLPGGGLKSYRNRPGSRSQTFSPNPQNKALDTRKLGTVASREQDKDKPLPLLWTTSRARTSHCPYYGR